MIWTVHEKQMLGDGVGMASLLFASDYSVRRVRNYPAGWFELSSGDLVTVSLGR